MVEVKHPIDPGQRNANRRTICEIHREMYRLAAGLPDSEARAAMLERIAIAYDMAKRMNARLCEYKAGWDAGFWPKKEDHHG